MARADRSGLDDAEKTERKAAREMIAAYHDEQLRRLLEHVRDGFAQLDAGAIDAFGLDDLIHRYKRAAKDLWLFCGATDGQVLQAARGLEFSRSHGEEPDWWARSARRGDSS